jgi:D-alanyl-lipoteichoic acid acyltransferase DltB (MBOAT superfamily)
MGPKAAQAWILVASIIFYSSGKPSNLPYLAISILVNCLVGRAIDRANGASRKRLLQFGLALNIAYLCVFKYVNFFLSNIHFLLPRSLKVPNFDFPLGISFFTLTQIIYLIDTYEELLPAMNLFDYSTFVSFFPYVISGPIPKAKRIQHQFGNFGGKQGVTVELIARGFYLFTIGLFKKVIFADVFAKVANGGFNSPAHLSALEVWCFSVAFTLQIYFDFSGYSDMAIGSALMLGIQLPRNFDSPLRAKSIIEFWKRWHITLSEFITTYLFTPLFKSLKVRLGSGLGTSALATLVAMTIAGLWHGPAWTFVLYGMIHGAALACNQFWRKRHMPVLPGFLSWLLTFVVVDLALLVFRAPDLAGALKMGSSLVNPNSAFALPMLKLVVSTLTKFNLVVLPFGIALAFFGKSSDELSREFTPSLTNAMALSGMFVACCLFMTFNSSQEFLYFKF